jgi:hypothetical protein
MNHYPMILSNIAELTVRQTALPHHGDVAPLRAAHLRIADRPFHAEAVSGTARPADRFHEATTATLKRTRGKKGTSTVVVRHGASIARGLFLDYEVDPTASRVPVSVIEDAVWRARREHGFDAVELARIATFAYDLPPLIGGEFASWSEVLPDDVSAGVDGSTVAVHTSGPYYGNTAPKLKAWPTRYALPAVRARKGEELSETVTMPVLKVRKRQTWDSGVAWDGYEHDVTVTRLSAPCATPDRRFIGHRACHRQTTVHGKRVARTYLEQIKLTGDYLASLVNLASIANKGESYTWRTDDGAHRGTLTVSPTGRYSVTVKGSDIRVRGAKSPQGIAKNIAPALN